MSFADDLQGFTVLARQRLGAVFASSAEEVHRSVQTGSPITGAPGQPVDTGFLRNSWILDFVSADRAQISTNVAYAPVIEDNARESYDDRGVQNPQPRQPGAGGSTKSTVGGNHSVRLTLTGWENIVRTVNAAAGGTP